MQRLGAAAETDVLDAFCVSAMLPAVGDASRESGGGGVGRAGLRAVARGGSHAQAVTAGVAPSSIGHVLFRMH